MDDGIPQLKQSKDKKTVFVKAVFLKVGGIDTVKEQFMADVFIKSRWREPSLDHSKESAVNDFAKYWNPKLVIQNGLPDVKQTTWTNVRLGKNGEAYIVEKRRLKGHFNESLELQDFPFDIQDLSIIVSSELSEAILDIVEDDLDLSVINIKCFLQEQEWALYDFVDSEIRELDKESEYTEPKFRNPGLLIRCVASRKAGFFLWNIVLIMMLISTLAFATFTVDRSLTQNRLQLSFIITLTGVAFIFVTNQSLPKISYLTHLDRYILGCMVFNWMATGWHAIISLFTYDESYQADLDFWAFITFILLYCVLQIAFLLMVLIHRLVRANQVKKRELKYQEKAKQVMGISWKKDRNRRRHATQNVWNVIGIKR